jgi:hypothetical protein
MAIHIRRREFTLGRRSSCWADRGARATGERMRGSGVLSCPHGGPRRAFLQGYRNWLEHWPQPPCMT